MPSQCMLSRLENTNVNTKLESEVGIAASRRKIENLGNLELLPLHALLIVGDRSSFCHHFGLRMKMAMNDIGRRQ